MLLNVHGIIEEHQYLSRMVDGDIIDSIIYEFSGVWFLAKFRMHRSSFWDIN